jgi:DNA-binding transcriptional LysR family regulator
VSCTPSNFEGQLGVTLFDRSARYPTLTEDGRALLQNARAVADQMDGLKARAKTLAREFFTMIHKGRDGHRPMT